MTSSPPSPARTHSPTRLTTTPSPDEFVYLSILDELDDKLNAAVIDCSTQVWNVLMVRPNQIKISTHLIDPSKSRNIIICDQTGSGKTHVYRIAGVIERGLICTVVPLLMLSADQLAKFKEANQ